MKVRDIMTAEPETCAPATNLAAVPDMIKMGSALRDGGEQEHQRAGGE